MEEQIKSVRKFFTRAKRGKWATDHYAARHDLIKEFQRRGACVPILV